MKLGKISLSNHIKIMLHITKVSKFKRAKRKERFKDTIPYPDVLGHTFSVGRNGETRECFVTKTVSVLKKLWLPEVWESSKIFNGRMKRTERRQ